MRNKLLANHALRVESRGRDFYHVILFNQWKLVLEFQIKSTVNTKNYVQVPGKVSRESGPTVLSGGD